MAKDFRLRLKKEELRRLYLEEKKSLEDIARLYDVSRVAVWKYCLAEGLVRRTRSEARLEVQKKGKVPQNYFDIYDSFFSKWSSEMAYVLGLIITDGCVAAQGTVLLSLNDKSLLQKAKRALGSDHDIRASKHQKNLYLFQFGKERISRDLLRLGIGPKKSLTVNFPKVPNEYLRDFIRGVFDGDGSVYFEARSAKYPLVTKFVGGSKSFVYELEKRLQGLGMPKRNIYEQRGRHASYMFKYSHKDSIRLYHLLYDGVNNGLYLERKFNKFKKGACNGKTY